ncbi:hypothetical protein HQ606_08705 [Rhodococcus kroppenstedtii]|uniref:Transmembrane protein n=1 Tax=Rhodococcoides kroppenstedtii TaxID=293050 RepID=A0ABS7NSP9_9NOCA|nr:hypothetical protein [Rhodococcus kroppenstedtii]MBY6321032.1 hypothetical protein [Rhodococcus kroppenstedtii]MBY6399579.1 hypothetical protein [Rhodococcus kroppenstedtii]
MRARVGLLVWSVLPATIALGPLLGALLPGGGHLLLRDGVTTPRSHLTDSALGLGEGAARAVPQDAVVAVASSVIDGGALVVGILLLALTGAGVGAGVLIARLLDTTAAAPRMVAATVAIWNPYVAERLLQGHWSLLVGYAALPWTVVAAAALRREIGPRSVAAIVLCLGIAGLTPTGLLMNALLAVAVVLAPGAPRRLATGIVLSATALLSAPWSVAALTSGAGAASDPAGVAAFAARAEPGLGTVGSLAGLGGIWNGDAVPSSRTTWWALVGTALLLVVAAAGVPALWRRRSPVIVAVTGLGLLAVLVAALAATPLGLDVGRWAAESVPGAGLLRDGQKWVALWMPGLVLATAAAASSAVRAGVASLLVVAALPDLAWGVGGALRPVQYPDDWTRVAATIGASERDVAVLPSGTFRVFPFSGDVPVLDPAPRWLAADVLQTGDLPVGGQVVAGEGERAREVEDQLLAGRAPDPSLGVGWVLIEATSRGEFGRVDESLGALDAVHAGPDLLLYRVPDAVTPPPADRTAAVATHLLWAGLTLAAGAIVAAGTVRSRRR